MTANALQKKLFRIGQMAKENFAGSVSDTGNASDILFGRKMRCTSSYCSKLYHSTSKIIVNVVPRDY